MNDQKLKTLKLMKGLPQDMIDEYESCEVLPPLAITIEPLCKVFKCTREDVGYTKDVICKIKDLHISLFPESAYLINLWHK